MRSPISPSITLDRVSKRYGDKAALDRVSTTIHPGQFVAIVGCSGAGKTTLLRALCRAITVSDGTLRVGGQELGALRGRAVRAYRRRVGMVRQQFNPVRRLRVLDNVLVGRLGHLRGLTVITTVGNFVEADDTKYRIIRTSKETARRPSPASLTNSPWAAHWPRVSSRPAARRRYDGGAGPDQRARGDVAGDVPGDRSGPARADRRRRPRRERRGWRGGL